MDVREWYLAFAEFEAAGSSPIYERWAREVADSPEMMGRLDALPPSKRQPNLLFAAARFVGVPLDDPPRFVERATSSWRDVSAVMQERSTQTNEAARTGTILPIICEIDGPVALIEVGCSAGLCLYPDRYGISYDQRPPLVADSPVAIDVVTSGPVLIPTRLPDVVARIGVDLNPIDARDPIDQAWLEALVWPEHQQRLERLRAAMSVVISDPPVMLRGNLIERIDEALSLVRADVTPVVFHSAVFNYIPPADRQQFARRLDPHPGVVWISNEGPGVVDGLTTDLRPPSHATSAAYFITGRDGTRAVGISDPHGSWISWPADAGMGRSR